MTDFWEYVATPLKIVQTTALLEILHSMLGLVRSPVMTTALQGRTDRVFQSQCSRV